MAVLSLDQIVNKLSKDTKSAPVLQTSAQSFIRENMTIFSDRSVSFLNKHGWSSFVTLRDNDPPSIPTKLRTGLNTFDNFLNITPYQLSTLVPKLKFYKTYFKNGEYEKDVPIVFPDSSRQNIESILSSKDNRSDDIALKSFSFDFNNQNPYAAGRAINCSLRIQMTSGNSLTKLRPNNFRISDLIVRSAAKDPKAFDGRHYEIRVDVGYEYPDNLTSGLKRDIENLGYSMILTMLDYDISFQQNGVIDLEISYRGRVEYVSSIVRDYDIFANDKNVEALRGQIALTEDRLENINLQEHEAMSNPDSVSTSYDADLFDEIDALEEQRSALAKNLQELQSKNRVEKYQQILSYMSKYGKIFKVSFKKEDLLLFGDAFQAAVDAEVKKELLLDSPDLIGVQKLLIDAKAKRDSLGKSVQDQINTVTSASPFSLQDVNIDKLIQERAEKLANERNIDLQFGDSADTIEVYRDANAEVTHEALTGKLAFQTKPVGSDGKAASHPDEKGKKQIYWFYYGDLIDAALKVNKVYEKMNEDKIACVLSNFDLTVFSRSTSAGTLGSGTKTYVNKKIKKVSIPDVPITVQDFEVFWNKFVVDKERDNYTVFDFIKDTLQHLLTPAVNVMIFGNVSKDAKVFKNVPMDFPAVRGKGKQRTQEFFTYDVGQINPSTGKQLYDRESTLYKPPQLVKGKTSLVFPGAEIQTETQVPIRTRVDLDTPALRNRLRTYRRNLQRTNSDQRWSYFVFYEANPNEPLLWDGNVSKDKKRGIFHYHIGNAAGIVKSINFTKTQRPGQTELMAERSLRSGDQTAELWRNFEASLSLEGTNMYFPGMYLYIDPASAGFGSLKSAKSLSRILGLGGYYLVLGASHVIDSDGWRTEVRAVWQSSPALNKK